MTSKTATLTGFGFGWSPDDPPHWDPSMSDPIEDREFLEATPVSQRPKVGAYVKTPRRTDQGLAWEYGRSTDTGFLLDLSRVFEVRP